MDSTRSISLGPIPIDQPQDSSSPDSYDHSPRRHSPIPFRTIQMATELANKGPPWLYTVHFPQTDLYRTIALFAYPRGSHSPIIGFHPYCPGSKLLPFEPTYMAILQADVALFRFTIPKWLILNSLTNSLPGFTRFISLEPSYAISFAYPQGPHCPIICSHPYYPTSRFLVFLAAHMATFYADIAPSCLVLSK